MHRWNVLIPSRVVTAIICGLWVATAFLLPVISFTSHHDAANEQSVHVSDVSSVNLADTSGTESLYRLSQGCWRFEGPLRGLLGIEIERRLANVKHPVDHCVRETLQPTLLGLGVAFRL